MYVSLYVRLLIIVIHVLLSQSEAYVLQAIQMALQTPVVYHKMVEVFSRYEAGTLKGQKGRKHTTMQIQKALSRQYSAKLHHFKLF